VTTFRQACEPYFMFSPIMSNRPYQEPDGNGPVYNAHYFSILKMRGELDPVKDREHFLKSIGERTISPGVYNRSFTKLEHNSHDNYIGDARCAQLLAPEIADDIYRHGLCNDWVYNNTGKTDFVTLFRAWHWRLTGVAQHYKLCANHPVTPFDEWAFCIDKIYTNFKPFNATSGRLLDLLKIEAYVDGLYQSDKLDSAVNAFANTIESKYPSKLSGVYGGYFGDEHPFATHTKNFNVRRKQK